MKSLNAEHIEKLRQSALSDEQINRLGWVSLPNGRLEIPYLRPDGSPEQCSDGTPFRRWRLPQSELDAAKASGRKGAKYLSPSKNGCRIYHSRLAMAAGGYAKRLEDRFTPLRITEGELKTEAATAHDPGTVTIGLGGVTSWQDRRDGGEESKPLPDFDDLDLKLMGREVRLCFDSDLAKPQVAAALEKLSWFLEGKGARVLIEVLPHGLDGQRLGVDDLIYRHGPELFHELASIARSPFKARGKKILWAFNPEPQDTRERNAYVLGMLGGRWRSLPTGKDHWQRWTGTHWEEVVGDDDIARELEQFAALQGWRNRELTALRSLQAAFRRSLPSPSDGDTPWMIPLINGCLKLPELKLLPHDPGHGYAWCLPYAYDPVANCRSIQNFLLDRLGDPASVAVFRAFARGLITGARLKCFLEITGASNTGKSVITNLLAALVGTKNTCAGKLHRLENPALRFETYGLKDKRLAIFSECQDFNGQLQTLKAITGGDPIGAEIKGGRQLHFVFAGGVVLTGNGPIRASDPTGAVINRRRSLHVPKVVAAGDERKLLDPDGHGSWCGELAGELPGFLNWCLAMPEDEARRALARDVSSLSRAEAELQTLLESDNLADWADQRLVFQPGGYLSVGVEGDRKDECLYPSYRQFINDQGPSSRPLSLKIFKAKLVDLLRDTLGLPLPPGNTSSGDYRQREVGSVVPCVAWKNKREVPGIIRFAFMARAGGMPAEWIGNGRSPLGNGWNGWNGSADLTQKENDTGQKNSCRGDEAPASVPAVPSIPHKGFGVMLAIPGVAPTVPVGSGADAMADDDDPYWPPRPADDW